MEQSVLKGEILEYHYKILAPASWKKSGGFFCELVNWIDGKKQDLPPFYPNKFLLTEPKKGVL
jgi:hypothetical protein